MIIAVMIIAIPIIVSIPVVVRAPLMTLGIIPDTRLVPAAVPFRIQFRPGIVCLAAVLAMFVDLVAIMFLGILHAMLTSGTVVGRHFYRECKQKGRGYGEGGGTAQKFSSLHS